MKVYNNQDLIAAHVIVADRFIRKFIGLMGKKRLKPKGGLLLKNCSSIHCFFMRIPIDAVYLSKDFTVLKIETVQPWRIGSFVSGTKHVLELAEGAAASLKSGDRITCSESTLEIGGKLL